MNKAVVTTTANLVEMLPVEDGIVTRLDRELSNGDVERVWAIEFNGQTVKIEFVFDDSIEDEEAFAALVAKGAGLLRFLLQKYIESEVHIEDLLKAFQVTFNVLQNQKMELEEQIPQDDERNDPPTVGEKNE